MICFEVQRSGKHVVACLKTSCFFQHLSHVIKPFMYFDTFLSWFFGLLSGFTCARSVEEEEETTKEE